MHKWMEEDRKSHGWRHISAFASDEITPTAGSACVVLLNSPPGQLAGVSEYVASINLCRSHEALRAASPVHEQRGDVDHHRLPLLVFFRRQHGEGLAPLQSIDCTFHQRLLFC